MTILEELKDRGILKQISNETKFNNLIPKKTGVYVGFDPTAQSLHLGNYVLMCNLKRFQKYGFKTYAVLGGATGMIGDPSFKDSERVLLKDDVVIANKNKIRMQLERMGFQVIDNYDFYKNMTVLEFLRDAGKLINVSYMMAKESVQKRIQRGISFTEFSYQVLQGFDFLTLYKNNNVKIQLGGSDQWGNIVTGLDMIETVVGPKSEAVVLTLDLLTDSNGKKIGKSLGGGGLWLDKNMNSPFNMYQFLLTQPDSEVEKMLMWLTFLKPSEIRKIINQHNKNPKKQYAQKILAKEVVKDIFGLEELNNAELITRIIFDKDFNLNTIKTDELEKIELYLPTVEIAKNSPLVDELIKQKIIQSKREAREFINSNALKVDDEVINETTLYNPKNFSNKYAFFKKGKKQTILLKTKK